MLRACAKLCSCRNLCDLMCSFRRFTDPSKHLKVLALPAPPPKEEGAIVPLRVAEVGPQTVTGDTLLVLQRCE
jgi:hypothetical protein